MVPLAIPGATLLLVVAAALGEQTEQPPEIYKDLHTNNHKSLCRRCQQLLRGATLDVVLLHGPFGGSTQPSATIVVAPPGGLPSSSLEAFVATDFTRDLSEPGRSERLRSSQQGPQLRFRYRSACAGLHSWAASLTLPNGSITGRNGQFVVAEAWTPGARGFAEIAPNGRYFMQDSKPLFLIGGNIECWDCVIGEKQWGGVLPSRAPANGTYEFDRWFSRLAAVGGNFARLWINAPQGIWTELAPGLSFGRGGNAEDPVKVGGGLGHYDQASMWRVDYILDLAERLGISVLVSIEMARTEDAGREWPGKAGVASPGGWSAYSKINGGMCENASEFWTNEDAMVAFERRLRYLVARFSHHSSLFAFELFNEVNCMHPYDQQSVALWHRRMSQTIKKFDPYGHFVTTSFCGDPMNKATDQGMKEIYSDVGIDFSQTHQYQNLATVHGKPHYFDRHLDAASEVATRCVAAQGEYGVKPHYFGEFGLKKRLGEIIDTTGLSLHNAYFAALMSGCAGTPGAWWWSTYIDRFDLYPLFKPVSQFAKRVDWSGLEFQAINTSSSSSSRTEGLRILASYGTNRTTAAKIAIVWVQHINSTWSWTNGSCSANNVATGPTIVCNISGADDPFPRVPRPLRRAAFSVALPEVVAGSRWKIEWFDTWRGLVTTSLFGTAVGGGVLELEIPYMVQNDTAAIITALPDTRFQGHPTIHPVSPN